MYSTDTVDSILAWTLFLFIYVLIFILMILFFIADRMDFLFNF